MREKKTLKIYHAILLLVLCLGVMFFISPKLGMKLGLYGSLIGEILFLLLSILIVVMARGDMKKIFPIHKPKLLQFLGAFLLWGSTLVSGMIVTLILSYFFPEQVLGVSQELGSTFVSVPFIVSFFIVAISPGICEEAVFRGVVLHSFSPIKNKWIIMIISGCIFGLFHGSIWRFFPTAMLGIVFGYIVMETDNLLYTVILHSINNGFSIVILYLSKTLFEVVGVGGLDALEMERIPLMSVATYIVWGCAIPLLLYIGNYLLHRGQPGYQRGLFPREKRKVLITLMIITAVIFFCGACLMLYSFIAEPNVIKEMMQQLS
ncbi:CPBP family glutamic-type intramembrane protease [Lachnospiraceae bacterium LCP25S3_G4]